MKYFFAIATIGLVAFSCSENKSEKKIIKIEKKVMYKPMAAVTPNRKLNVEVSGMTCEHACGGSIRMALKNTNAVDRVQFDFEDGRKVNTAIITFDKNKISADEIVAIIEKTNDNQFTTGKVSSESFTAPKASPQSEKAVSTEKTIETTKVNVEAQTGFEFPNLYKLFSKIIS
ncbi:MAG: heavy-metal-associated domain-containing protein [Fluviicola sp.]|jgi:copper chaperone CopZ